MELAITVAGDQGAANRLLHMGSRARRAEPLLRDLMQQLEAVEKERFEHGRFRKLSAATKARKAREHQDPRPLRATGALMRSLTMHAPGAIREVHNDYLVFGTSVKYARFAQYGIGEPTRKVISLTKKSKAPLVKTIMDYILGGAHAR